MLIPHVLQNSQSLQNVLNLLIKEQIWIEE